jgi:hypothetical protein
MARWDPDSFSSPAPTTGPAGADRPLARSGGAPSPPAIAAARALFLVGLLVGLLAGVVATQALPGSMPERVQQDPQLAQLLRAMVLAKGAILMAAAALVFWRLGRPAPPLPQLGYTGALALSAAAVGWMWGLSAIPLAAALFYGGLIAALGVGSRDARRMLPPAALQRR